MIKHWALSERQSVGGVNGDASFFACPVRRRDPFPRLGDIGPRASVRHHRSASVLCDIRFSHHDGAERAPAVPKCAQFLREPHNPRLWPAYIVVVVATLAILHARQLHELAQMRPSTIMFIGFSNLSLFFQEWSSC